MDEGLIAEVTRLDPERRRALEILLAREGISLGDVPLAAHGGDGPFPLSFQQRRLWFIHLLAADKSVYNVAWPIGIEGRLDRAALSRSLAEIVRRHAILRTRFDNREGEPVQAVVPDAAAPLPTIDLAALPGPIRQAERRRLVRSAARQPFDLRRAPLLRTLLLRTGAGSHVLLLTLHHIVSDGWSAGILLDELGTLYSASRRGLPSPLPVLRHQYFDYAISQRDDAHAALLETQLGYWTRRLAGVPGGLDLPVDRPRPPVLSYRGALRPLDLAADLRAGIESVSRRGRATPFMTLLAVFQVGLLRHTHQVDLAVGSPIANRNRTEIEPLIGLFVNTLVLRGDLSGDPTFLTLLERVRDSTLEDLDHQDVPFERLVEALRPQRSLDRQPLVQVMFQLQNAPRPPLALEGLELSSLEIEPETTPFDLALTLAAAGDGFSGYLQYSTDLFDGTTAGRLLERFRALLEGVVASPESRLSELPAMAAAERHQTLVEWHGAPAGEAVGARLDELVAARAAAGPDAVAAVDRHGSVTYGELERLASRVAWRLARMGVGPEEVVGLLGDRSVAMVAGMLGILGAGGAYLPLDPLYPRERLVLMLEDSGARVVVVPRRLRAVVEEILAAGRGWAGEVLWLDDVLGREGEPWPLARAGPDNLAYVIYTSGSTGRPKGVAIEHRSAVAFVRWARGVFTDDDLSGVFASTSICFDLSVFEIFVPLAWGGRVIVGEDALALASHPAAAGVRLLNTVPSAAATLAATGRLPASLRTVNLAGEPLQRELTDRLYRQPGVERVLNLYGPSEDTTYSTWAAVDPGARRQPTIGRPVAATRAYLLDRRLQPVPVGVRGELYLGGEGLARGYLDRAALTAERFVPDRFAAVPGARLYRTGDLARALADGRIEFLGRLDAQVKLRGFRIEPGEVEALLTALPEVAQAAVVARRDGPIAGETSLVAYWVAAAPATASEEQLRGFLASRLPAFMMPSSFVRLDSLPLTPNGKVDRGALPAPAGRPRPALAPSPPGTGLERAVAEIWKQVLKVESVDLHANFFDLGGHSLLLAQLHARLIDRFGRDFPMVELFRYPTVKTQAAFVASMAPAMPEAAAEPAAPGRAVAAAPIAGAVAVIGMAGRFPGAADVDELWDNLCRGVESITFFSKQELAAAGVEPELLENPDYVRAKGVLAGAADLDAAFFGMSRREAEITDPQQRVFLETAWAALEDAGLDPARHPGRVGVFAGTGLGTYLLANLAPHPEVRSTVSGYQLCVANDKDFLPTRVSYKLDLRGPSVAVQTACSTSLVAVHLACKSLLDGECDVACAGGVTISFPQEAGYLYQEGGIGSPDGHCRAFDRRAQGTTFGNGAGVVVLQRLDAAVAGGYRVRAVIRGSAVNNDGAAKVGYTAPSIEGQSRVIAAAQAAASCPPETITCIEAHGTGTALGDPIEVAALRQVFGAGTGRASCALGSIKTNLGHLDAAAGVAGLIKTVLALEHGRIPPTLHFESPNPHIDFADGPFYVPRELREWHPPHLPRRAGVSSFGIGGTNAHVVLEEAPALEPSGPAREWQLLPLSARSAAALDATARNLARHLETRPGLPLPDVAFTLQVGRGTFGHRRAVYCRDRGEAIAALRGERVERVLSGVADRRDRPVAFLFPGQGAQQVDMGRELLATEPVFRAELESCAEILRPLLEIDLLEVIYPQAGGRETARELLRQTRFAQPALFAFEYALARLWMSWGVAPEALLGHSVGEYVAACLAGVFSLPDALRLLALRGGLMDALPSGSMLAVAAPAEDLAPLMAGEDLCVAALNEPGRVVLAGSPAAVAALEERLAERGTACRRLETSHAFHSQIVEPVMEPFRRELAGVERRPPERPWVSTLTGAWITPGEAQDPGYWTRQMRAPVRFYDALSVLLEEPDRLLLEVGPGRTLAGFARRHPARREEQSAVSSSPAATASGGGSEQAALVEALGRLWVAGAAIDWTAFHSGGGRRRCALPGYPFERQRLWIAAPAGGSSWLGATRPLAPEPAQREVRSNQTAAVSADHGGGDMRRDEILHRLSEIFGSLLGVPASELDPAAPFVALGADSLILLQAAQSVERAFGLRIPFRRLVEEHHSVAALADHLLRELPPPPPPAVTASSPLPAPAAVGSLAEAASAAAAAGGGNLAPLVRLLSDQLELLRAAIAAQAPATETRAGAAAAPSAPAAAPAAGAAAPEPRAAHQPRLAPGYLPDPYIAYREIDRGSQDGLTPRQRQHLRELIARLGAKTSGSKRMAAESRPFLADERSVAGFRQVWKELQYPLHAQRGAGARVWDVDGNEYVDITMGFGSLLYGHTPAFIQEAIREHLSRGIQIGLLSPLAGRAARLICEMTGLDRAAFFNSGTEAVMVALRLARARTRRTRIAVFAGSYHGWSDEVMVRMEAGSHRAVPMAPGVSPHVSDNVLIFDYCSPESVAAVRAHAHELAAVVVEPQQSRRPGFATGDFLRALREVTSESGAALIFDEVITGFRMHPGGAQALYGVEADLVTYGKSIGGGIPIGAVAGRNGFMDGVDGGEWRYGDASYPREATTYIAGTYIKHPLTMAAVCASLDHLRQAGPGLQEDLNRSTERLVARLDGLFEEEEVPLRMMHFGSLFRFVFERGYPYPELFFFHLLDHGVYVWEGRACYLSTAHTEGDLEHLVEAVRRSVGALREGGFLPPRRRPPAADPRQAPMTEAQTALWAVCQTSPQAARAYNECLEIELGGNLRREALGRALQRLADRHETLRTTFGPLGDTLIVHPRMPLELAFQDLSGLEPERRRGAAEEILDRDAAAPFDFERGPLARARLLRLEPVRHVLGLTLHHLITDGLSNGVLLRELGVLYTAEGGGGTAELPPAVPFRDFVSWQTERQSAETLARSEDYWLESFADPPPPLELPFDRPRPALRGFLGGRQTVTFGDGLRDRLTEAAKSRGTTVFTLLLAGWQLLLHRLSGQSDLVVGVTAAGQAALGEAAPVGYCVSLLPIRSRLDGDPSWSEYLAGRQRALLDAFEHQDYPFHRLVRRLGLPRTANRSPLVSVLFNMDRVRDGAMRLGDLEARVTSRHNGGAKDDLYLDLTLGDRAVAIACEHDRALLDPATVRRWLGHLESLLESALADPDRAASLLPLLRPGERLQILAETTSTERPADPRVCLPQRIEARVDRHPDAVAVGAAGRHLSYGGLDLAAGRLAHRLRRLGVGPEVRVGICLERSEELVVALLAVLKAGGAYVPLDPGYPHRRLEHIVRSSRPAVLVTRSGSERWAGGLARHVLVLDREPALADRAPVVRPLAASAGAGDLAYVLYTSGSTGEPKGVAVPHSALANCLVSMLERPGLADHDVLLAVTTLAFDIAALELFLPLLAGGRVEIVTSEVARDGLELRRALERSGATVMQATPSTWRMLLAAGWTGAPRFRMLCGGEALPRPLADALLSGGGELWNVYGPTETTIWSTVERIEAGSGPVTAGHPIADTSVRVLDRGLELAPPGVVGEIYLGGGGLARGYAGRGGLTAERFVPDPLAAGGQRLYRTGDLGRLRPGGRLEVLGRVDHQVKIHGARIELGEIEAALSRHPGVAQAVAVVHGDAPGERWLVAYVVPRARPAPTAGELRDFLRDSLPAAMLPSAFVELSELPLTPNGKLDRRALPAPDRAVQPSTGAFAAPRTPTERLLAGLWEEILGLEAVGRLDHFVGIGGDSITAVRVAVRARQLGLRVTPTQIFQQPVLAELAARVEPDAAGEAAVDPGELPLTPAQRWFFELGLDDPHHWNQSMLLELHEPVPAWSLRLAVGLLAARHDSLCLRFASSGDGWRAFQVPPQEACSFASIDLSALPPTAGARALETAAARLQSSLDLTRGPLGRIALFETRDPDRPRLLLVLHHALVDDASWRFLLADLLEAARQRAGGRRPILPPPTASFRRWAGRLAELSRSPELFGELPFWLDPARAHAAPLAVDLPGGAGTEASARAIAAEIDADRTQRLRQQAGRSRVQIAHLVLAALARAFASRFGAVPLLVDLEGHGREDLFPDLDLSRTAGWFTCIYPVLLAAGDGSPAETVTAVCEQLRRVPRGGIGYGLLRYPREGGDAAAKLRALPRAEVVFNFSARPGGADTGRAPYGRARESAGRRRSPRNQRPYLIEIEGYLAEDRLRLELRYSAARHRAETIAGLARDFEDAVDRLLEPGLPQPDHQADRYPAARLSQDQLDRLIARMD